jgi:hypothetical protein
MRFEDGAPAGPPLPGGIDDANPNSPRLDSPAARFIVARVGTLAIDQAAGWIFVRGADSVSFPDDDGDMSLGPAEAEARLAWCQQQAATVLASCDAEKWHTQ